MIKNILPEIYLPFFPKELLNFPIVEKKATCDKCALSENRSPDKRSYKPNLKCCTFFPFQTNYLIGQILSSRTTPKEVRQRILQKIEKREYILPIGIVAPTKHQIEFVKTKEKNFGNREDWLCPYYDRQKNNCGIWKSRSSVCTSFHCLSSYGPLGFEFWDNLSNYISYTEMALSEEVLLKQRFTPMEISEQTQFLNRTKLLRGENPPSEFSEEFFSKIWKKYSSNPIGFYKKSFEIVANFSQIQFKKALGESGQIILKKLIYSSQKIEL